MRVLKGSLFYSILLVGVTMLSLTRASLVHSEVVAQAASVLDGKQIYFAESNRESNPFDRSEAGLSRFSGLLQQFGADVMPLDWRRDLPEDADLVVIAGATRRFDAGQTARLWAYLHNGGSVLIISDPLVITEEDEGLVTELNTSFESGRGFFELTWPDFGVRGRDDIIITDLVDQLEATSGLEIPDIESQAMITEFATSEIRPDHAINTGIDGELQFFGARSVEYDASLQPYRATPLIFAPAETYGETDYLDYLETGFVPSFGPSDTNPNTVAIAVASENPATQARLVVIGDNDFATNGGGMQTSPPNSASFVYPNNALFLVNAVAWLVDAEPVDTVALVSGKPTSTFVPITILTPGPTAVPLTAESPVPTILTVEAAATEDAGTTNE